MDWPKQVDWKDPWSEMKICLPLRISRIRMSSRGLPGATAGMVRLLIRIVMSIEQDSLGPREPFVGRMKM